MRMKPLAVAMLVAVASGCTSKPVFVQLDVKGPPSAQVTVRKILAETDLTPIQCTTPCRLEFPPDVVLDIELEASGYYPARVAAEYKTILWYTKRHDADEPPLVIPLLPRPDRPDE